MERPPAKHFLMLSALLAAADGRAQFTDDFSDGDFTNGPAWGGDDALFTVVDDGGGNHLLRSNSPGAATYWLSTPSALAGNVRWEWFINLRFATSGSNYADIWLMSDAADLTTALNGWFVRVGGTQDRVELFKRVGGTNASVLVSPDGIVNSSSSNPFRIRVERTATDDWTLLFDDGNTGTFASVGPVADAAVSTTSHFGILIVQSSAAGPINNHFFDDFTVGNIPVDLDPPQVLAATVLGAQQLRVQFDEAVQQASAENTGHYGISPFNTVVGASWSASNPDRVVLDLLLPMLNGNTYTLTITGVEDLAGNATDGATVDIPYIVPDPPLPGEVVINELMADPTPVVGLPEAEFVEFFNATTGKYFDLAGWKFSDGSSTAILPGHVLGPGQYVLLTSNANSGAFANVANRIGVGSLPSLNNDGDNLTLTAPDNSVIDAVSYSDSWYGDPLKEEGGWSLERINPFAPCSSPGNWRASDDPAGGSPGAPNSVFDPTPDTTPPTLTSVLVQDELTIELVFSEPMDAASLVGANYTIDPLLAVAATSAVGTPPGRARLTLGEPMVPGVLYTVTVDGATDCSGNPIGAPGSGSFAQPEAIAPGDLVINEVLYDPEGNGSDFVELFNRSGKTISLQGLQMANEANGAIANFRTIATEPLLLFGGEYILLTPGPGDIAARYPQSRTDRFLPMTLPSYNNGSGTVVLLDASGGTLDLFRYSDELHFALIAEPEGYSLERVDPGRPTDDPTNWQSAADQAGRATPGFRNSQYAPAPEPMGEMTIDPAIFSPDNDGHQDLLIITYRFAQPGFVGNLTIYDAAGREARRLVQNQLLGVEGAIGWDGILDNGSKGRVGPYIVVLEVFDLAGRVETHRKTVTLAHRLD